MHELLGYIWLLFINIYSFCIPYFALTIIAGIASYKHKSLALLLITFSFLTSFFGEVFAFLVNRPIVGESDLTLTSIPPWIMLSVSLAQQFLLFVGITLFLFYKKGKSNASTHD